MNQPSRARNLLRRVLSGALSAAREAGLRMLRSTPAEQPEEDQSGRGDPSVPASPAATSAGHEVADMSGGLMTRLAVGLLASAACVIVLMLLLNRWFHQADRLDQPRLTAEQTMRVLPPAPRLQTDAVHELGALHDREDALLHHYAWITPERRRARIPIDRAMILVTGRSLDAAP